MKSKDIIFEDGNPTSWMTTANGEAFIRDVFKAFGGIKGQSLNISVTLKGTNVLEYSIEKVAPAGKDTYEN